MHSFLFRYILGLILIFVTGCLSSNKNKETQKYVEQFQLNQDKYEDLIAYLIQNKATLKASPCVRYDYVALSERNLITRNCFPEQKDSLLHYVNADLFELGGWTVDRYLELEIYFKAYPYLDTETIRYYVYFEDESYLELFHDAEIKKRLTGKWWYIENTQSVY